jgi:D-alanyl-D-alanine carboxypeptidase
MIESMKSEGLSLMVVSGYRSFADQRKLYSMSATALNSGSYDRVAPAGQSEHQLGTAIDVASLTRSGVAFASSSESDWIETHAHEYGFIISYGEANENRTGYMYEPWHLRYVGLENANILRAGEYTLSYKPDLYSRSWLNAVLTKLKELL